MKLIPLTQGRFAKIDDEDYERVSQFKWCLRKSRDNNAYAHKSINNGDKRTSILLHRFILDIKDKRFFVDHIDHDGLNCQRSNIRLCSQTENARNRRTAKNKTSSKYLGVFLHKSKNKKGCTLFWRSLIMIDKKITHLGLFPFTGEGEVTAAMAYNNAAKKTFKEFANLNYVQ